jgi:hypothetical protein
VGATQATPAAGPDLRVEEFRDTFGERWHSSKAAEPTLREVSRSPEGQPFGAGQTPSGTQSVRVDEGEFQLGSQIGCGPPQVFVSQVRQMFKDEGLHPIGQER